MSDTARPDWRWVIRGMILTLVICLLLIQLFPEIYAVKDFWLVTVPSGAFWGSFLSRLLNEPGLWKLLVTSAEGAAMIVVLFLVVFRPLVAWKAYLVCVALTAVSAILFFTYVLPAMPNSTLLMVLTGSLYSSFRYGVTLALLYALALTSDTAPTNRQLSAHA